jgi:hypothetical protein
MRKAAGAAKCTARIVSFDRAPGDFSVNGGRKASVLMHQAAARRRASADAYKESGIGTIAILSPRNEPTQ